jgi:hypothetical protein
MLNAPATTAVPAASLDTLDRLVVAYLVLPLGIFLLGWLEIWASLPLLACLGYYLKPLIARRGPAARAPITSLQLAVALAVGGAWTALGGTGHLFFANFDWHIRDAVLHDLVVSPWPVGYGIQGGKETLLRAPIAYFLPAALIGKAAGLALAHVAMALWTAIGATLFLLQIFSLAPSRAGVVATITVVLVLFSGLDFVGMAINYGPRFFANWKMGMHLEWWAVTYQYSSMTTQLFWVPNHALGAWLIIGLLYRDRRGTPLAAMLPIVVVAAALWSPLAALGVVPFVLWKVFAAMRAERSWLLLHVRVWGPALLVGLVVAAYLTLDPGHIPKGWTADEVRSSAAMDVTRLVQFFLLEAGLIGLAVLAIRNSGQVAMALLILLLLPLAYFGPGNDLAMRASIPSLAVLAIGAALALCSDAAPAGVRGKKAVLATLLAIGAVTPVQEFARAAVLPAWPINLRATLIGADCGGFPPHYVAQLGEQWIGRLLRRPHRLGVGPHGPEECVNPALMLMWKDKLL